MKITIIDYGAGNVESVANALRFLQTQDEILVSRDLNDIRTSDRLILPGVSSFGETMRGLESVSGLLSEIKNQALVVKKPFLGVCAGMQVLASTGQEHGDHCGLGFIGGHVKKIETVENLKVPHMGWNNIILKTNSHPLLEGIATGEHFYFANSYHFVCEDEKNVLAQVEYGIKMNVVVAKENIFGTQFHPEKSGPAGLRLLKNFLDLKV